MYQKIVRLMNEREVRAVREEIHPVFLLKFAAKLGGIFLGSSAICYGLSLAFKPQSGGRNWLFVSALILAAWTGAVLFVMLGHAVGELLTQQGRRKLEEVLSDGTVTVEKVEASAVVEVPPNRKPPADGTWFFRDAKSGRTTLLYPENLARGPAFFFDVGDGMIFCLRGRECYRSLAGRLPNTRFEVIRTTKHNMLLGVICEGQELTPVRRIDRKTFNYCHLYGERVFAGSLATVEDDLRRLEEDSDEDT